MWRACWQPAPHQRHPSWPEHCIHDPGLSQELGKEGTARMRLRCAAYDVVQGVRITQSSGSPRLDRAALAPARQERIRPGTRYGVSQAGVVVLSVRFVLLGAAEEKAIWNNTSPQASPKAAP